MSYDQTGGKKTRGGAQGFGASFVLAILLVLHCLSLDAVAVLLIYQRSLEAWSGVELGSAAYWALGTGIWLGYTADRLRDVNPLRTNLATTLRHHFHRQHRRTLQIVWSVTLLFALVSGGLWLPPKAFGVGLGFAGVAALYVFSVSRRKRLAMDGPRLSKRFCVALLLGLSGLWWWPAWGNATWPQAQVLALTGLFALFASWELILMEGRRIRKGSFADKWVRWMAPLCIGLTGWVLGGEAYPGLLWGVTGFALLTRFSTPWPHELKSLAGDFLILSQFALLIFLQP